MSKIRSFLKKFFISKPLNFLIIFLPLAFLADELEWGALWVFIFSAAGIIPMAGLIGQATESLAEITGPKIGGLLNATLGNAAELIITLVAIKAGLLELVKASITGSILGNLLLVFGFSALVGGAKNGIQQFDKKQATSHALLLTIATLALVIPSLFSVSMGEPNGTRVEALSLGVAAVMLMLYIAGLIYTLRATKSPITYAAQPSKKPEMSLTSALILLAVATGGIIWMSELLVGAVEHVTANLGLSEFFLGIILIPIVGNAAEHLVAVTMAHRNQMELSMEIAVSSSIQVALLVAPVLVFVSLAMGHPLTLVFNTFELISIGAGVIITVLVASDGESNWLEGVALLGVYAILGLAFFLQPI
jgi:Ca2+:H+ antiporter